MANINKCDFCDEIFQSTKSNFIKHIKSVHKGVFEKKLKCNLCHKTFHTPNTLRNHYESIHALIRYACDVCEKTFNLMANLKKTLQRGS